MGRGPGQKPGQRAGSGQGPGPGRGQRQGQGQRPAQRPAQKPSRGWEQGGRPGPAAPHRGRKEKQLQNKLDNMKPKHPEEQEIPFRLRELMRSREAMKRPGPGKRRAAEKKQQPKPKGPEAPGDIPVPKFKRGKGESERSYVCRMEHEVQRILFLTKNQLQREPEKDATASEKSKRKKEFQNKKLEKARKKKEEKKEAMLEKSRFQDTVVFGEVVTQPPTITSRPRGQGPAEQAGRKRLLLTSRLGQSQVSPVSPAAPVSMARRRIVAEERARVIQAYRDIQRRKQQQREAARGRGRAGRGVPR
ncbi:coiled-coil domain-containing protein 137 [Columba livia]|uniref:coiled-coil domain-containing protein 137 n=1 Tax=Columba livia TaxID=8932 RepID=UPI0031BAF4D9